MINVSIKIAFIVGANVLVAIVITSAILHCYDSVFFSRELDVELTLETYTS